MFDIAAKTFFTHDDPWALFAGFLVIILGILFRYIASDLRKKNTQLDQLQEWRTKHSEELTKQQEKRVAEVKAYAETITDLSTQAATNVNDIAKATENMANALRDVVGVSDKLDKVCDNLKEIKSEYKFVLSRLDAHGRDLERLVRGR